MLLTGEAATRAFDRERSALGVTTAREGVLCHLLSASDFFFPTLPTPQRLWSSLHLRVALADLCYHGVYFLTLSHNLILQAEGTKLPETSTCLTFKE